MEYLTVTQAAEKWGISTRRVRLLCANGEIDGVIRKGKLYMIPAETEKPLDKRKLPNKRKRGRFADILTEIDIKKLNLTICVRLLQAKHSVCVMNLWLTSPIIQTLLKETRLL